MKKLTTAILAAALSLGTAAGASTFSLIGGSAGMVPGGNVQSGSPQNNVLNALSDVGPSLGGFFGTTVSVNSNTKVLIEVFGWEAAFDNQADVDGTIVGSALDGPSVNKLVTSPDTSSPVSAVLANLSMGQLNLTFNSFSPNCCGGVNHVRTVSNGANPDASLNGGTGNGAIPNFFASFGPGKEGARLGNSLWLFYDDDGVPGDNHDDLVIRISAVPLPAGFLLLLSGLGVLAARRRMS